MIPQKLNYNMGISQNSSKKQPWSRESSASRRQYAQKAQAISEFYSSNKENRDSNHNLRSGSQQKFEILSMSGSKRKPFGHNTMDMRQNQLNRSNSKLEGLKKRQPNFETMDNRDQRPSQITNIQLYHRTVRNHSLKNEPKSERNESRELRSCNLSRDTSPTAFKKFMSSYKGIFTTIPYIHYIDCKSQKPNNPNSTHKSSRNLADPMMSSTFESESKKSFYEPINFSQRKLVTT